MNGLRAGMSAPPLMAAARVAAGDTSLTCQEPTLRGTNSNAENRQGCSAQGRRESPQAELALGSV